MDWQHLIMNGENLAEYAALLAAEGLLGHQHANSGWGTFDDDNMVGATAFMETLELAVELRRAGYGDKASGSGIDLYPYTEDQVAAVERSVKQWRFIAARAARSTTRRCARRRGTRTRCAPTSSSTRRWGRRRERRGRARRRDAGLKALAVSEDGEVVGRAEVEYGALDAEARLGRAGPGGLVARGAGGARAARRRRGGRHRALGPDARARRARRGRAGAAPGDPLERPAHGRGVRRDRGADRARGADRRRPATAR